KARAKKFNIWFCENRADLEYVIISLSTRSLFDGMKENGLANIASLGDLKISSVCSVRITYNYQ
ncbi:MAG: hypothetical protein AAF575_15175, partial [Bacteroidota bacterium]